ncbi:hypothetical protein HYN51_15890 [Limnobaculum parvum]|uniref:Uncharacterized protein n=1 Tax=Limnobaculum parvum TaxID=2172103 RepID=A0A2Y9U2J4_9GAMM|nr:hypothetical protein HYN51_15890 [Limnobaculum parvum]
MNPEKIRGIEAENWRLVFQFPPCKKADILADKGSITRHDCISFLLIMPAMQSRDFLPITETI